ncbi:MAG: GWxTD domain-containing protein [Balneolaceae bacterium]|nr:MAG: GWxTD domain-containing protein [Balneolaceae bacterium]
MLIINSILSFLFLFLFEADRDTLKMYTSADLYALGVQAKEAGNAERAAELWIEYAEGLDTPSYTLGHELIKHVTKHSLRSHYEKASELYMNGFGAERLDDRDKELLHTELIYMEGMLGQRDRRQFRRMIDDGNTEILDFFRGFWETRNLTPSDDYNERLLEHWERVNFALENYNTSPNILFDDRGKTYIRFGEPNRTRSGVFMYNPGFANYVISTRMDDGRGQASSIENAVNTTTYLNTLYQVRSYHQYPSFEVWVYTELGDGPDNVVYIFGNTHGGAVMSEKKSVDDFIPSAAYSTTARNNPVSMGIGGGDSPSGATLSSGRDGDSDVALEGGLAGVGQSERIIPALVLQFMYYRQLASLDPFFSERYDEMMDVYMNTSVRLPLSSARRFQQLNSARVLIVQASAPDERSTSASLVFDISTRVHPYRFFDENLNPYLKIYFEEDTEEAISFEDLRKRNDLDDIRFSDYEVVRTILFEGKNGERFDSFASRDNVDQSSIDPLERNMLHIPYNKGAQSIVAHSELYDISLGDRNGISENSTLRENLRGIGNNRADIPEAVASSGLFTSDVIIGYRDEDLDFDSGFVIAHDRIIPAEHSLNFFYEAYNIPQGDDGFYSYSLTYRIARDRSRLGRIIRLGRTSETSMTINNTHTAPVFSQMLEIVTDELDSGNYILELLISEHEDSEVLHRETVSFSVR